MIGNYMENNQVNTGYDWPETRLAREAINRRCSRCHSDPSRLLPKDLADERDVSFWMPSMDDPRLRTSRHIVWNLSRPEKSWMLLAPLAMEKGGLSHCQDPKSGQPEIIFTDTSDPDYQSILALAAKGKEFLDSNKRFDTPGFTPRQEWAREMKRYGILPKNPPIAAICDPYKIEELYWRSFWYRP
jgi:hypothetical protein